MIYLINSFTQGTTVDIYLQYNLSTYNAVVHMYIIMYIGSSATL